MSLSNDLISQFVKATKDDKKTESESVVYGTTVTYNDTIYVKLDGSDLLTPVSTETDMKAGERVSVRIKNHTATVTGNMTSPSARTDDVKDLGSKITEVEILVANKVSTDQLEAEKARIDTLVAENVTVKEKIAASEADINTLKANDATITGKLNAAEADIENLNTTKISAEIADAKYATIENLDATNVEVNNLKSTYGEFKNLATDKFTAIEADIDSLEANKLSATDADLKYANIDFSNIGKAAVEKFYAVSGIIKDLVIGDTTVTGKLVGVTITGDLIEGGTVKADKLVVLGTDGLYYKLNTDGITTTAEQTEYNSLNGSVITAKSITAEKVNVDDLVAFDATIGGFNITKNSIHSGVKESADNTTRGIYLDKDGQLVVGDASNYLKYYKDLDKGQSIITSAIDSDGNAFNDGAGYIANYRINSSGSQVSASGYCCTGYISVQNNDVIRLMNVKMENNSSTIIAAYDESFTYLTSGNVTNSACATDFVWGEDGYLQQFTMSKADVAYIRLSTPISGGISGDSIVTRNKEITYGSYRLAISADNMVFSSTGKTVPDTIDESIGAIQESFSAQNADVIANVNSAISNALENYVANGDYTEFKETVNSQLSVLSDKITMNFESTISQINSVNGDLQNQFTVLKKYISYSEGGIELGSGENTLKLTVDNGLICFEQNGVVKGWWDGIDFHTGNIMVDVSEKAQFGNFAFVPRSDGSLMFLKVQDLVAGDNLFSISSGFCDFGTNVKRYKTLGDNSVIVYVSSKNEAAIHFTLDSSKTYKMSCTTRNASFSAYDDSGTLIVASDGSDGTSSCTITGATNCYFHINDISISSYMVRDVLLREVIS